MINNRKNVLPYSNLSVKLAALIPSLIVIAVYYIIIERAVFGYLSSDFPAHLNIIANGSSASVHQLYHYTVRAYSFLTGLDFQSASVHVTLTYALAAASVIYLILRNYLVEILEWHWILILLSTLFLISAIWLPFIHPQIYLRIGTPNPMHNPTSFAAKPFAFGIFLLFIFMIEARAKIQIVFASAAASLLVILSGYAKPNFNLAFIFAAPLYLFISFALSYNASAKADLSLNPKEDALRGRNVYIFAPIAVALGVLSAQYLFKFDSDQGGGIGFGIANIASLNNVNPYIALIQLSAFPLILIFLIPRILKDRFFLFALLLFVVSFLQFFFLLETGNRVNHGNFGWGRMIVAPLLFSSALGFLVREWLNRNGSVADWRLIIPSLVYLAHLVSGVVYMTKLSFGTSFF